MRALLYLGSGVLLSFFLSFQNIRPSLLECTSCKNALKIDIPWCLSATARTSLTCKLEQELAAVHKESCPFRHDAEAYLRERQQEGDEDEQQLVPTLLAQVWPDSTMNLLDHPRPGGVLFARWKQLFLGKLKNTGWTIPACFENNEQPDLLSKLVQMAKASDTQNNAEESATAETSDEGTEKLAMGLVLLGWEPENSSSGDVLRCSVCKACLCNSSAAQDAQQEELPSAKRRRASTDIAEAHRHYCPYVCGFPWSGASCATPLWESLAARLVCQEDATEATPSASWMTVHNILKSGVSPAIRKEPESTELTLLTGE